MEVQSPVDTVWSASGGTLMSAEILHALVHAGNP